MDIPHPTAGWEQLGKLYYRKIQLYSAVFDPGLDLDNYIVAAAPYAGAIALSRDDSKLVAYHHPTPSSLHATKPSIDIYSCAGKLIRSIAWSDHAVIKGLGWSNDEKLLVVTRDGSVRCYVDLDRDDFTQFSLGYDTDNPVVACRFYQTGLVALLANNALVAVTSYDEPRPKLLATIPSALAINHDSNNGGSSSSSNNNNNNNNNSPEAAGLPPPLPTNTSAPATIHAWTVLAPQQTSSRSVEVLVAVGRTVLVVDTVDCEDRLLDIGPFVHVRASPNGQFVALYGADGRAHIVASDFQHRFAEYDSRSRIAPKAVEWCGNDALVIAWEDEVHLVGGGPGNSDDDADCGTRVEYFYDNRVHVLADYDGVRIITNDVCDFIQRVPDVTEDVFRIGSDSPASILLDAVEQLALQSPKADDNLQLIRDSLVDAVNTCVNAAGHEFHVHWQKQLLAAASLGKSVLDLYNSDDFVDMCDTLRVLNAVRFYRVGLPLSYDQYARLTPSGLVTRLLTRGEYLLALRIAAHLRLPTSQIYEHWACAKVRRGADDGADDDAVARLVVARLAGQPGVRFETMARAAYDEGRARLATALLHYEPRAGRQVPLLLMMGESDVALDKALESADGDLIHLVLHNLRRDLPLAGFFRLLNTRPVATALVEAAALYDDAEDDDGNDRHHHHHGRTAIRADTSLLKDLYYQDDRRVDGADVFLREALLQPDPRTASDKLALAAKLVSDQRDATLELHALREAQALLRVQAVLDRDLTDSFLGLSLTDTLFKLLRLGYHGRAKKMWTDFRVPDRVVWWTRLRALVATRDWTAIEELSRQRKSPPIGWEPFFTLVLRAGNARVAARFIPKCQGSVEPGTTITMYERCGMPVKAAEEAVRLQDQDTWVRLLEAAGRESVDGREIARLGGTVFLKKGS